MSGSSAATLAGPLDVVVVSCEHGGNRIPAEYAEWFRSSRAQRALASHRGYDPGALVAAGTLAEQLDTLLIASDTSRLLVELNRSPRHRRLFSEFSNQLSAEAKAELFERYYHPYRDTVDAAIRDRIDAHGQAIHVSVHTFTPRFAGQHRPIDVAWLYDPRRAAEREFCRRWRAALQSSAPTLRLFRNAPYRGTSDGLTTSLRRRFAEHQYLGVELEISQQIGRHAAQVTSLAKLLSVTLRQGLVSISGLGA